MPIEQWSSISHFRLVILFYEYILTLDHEVRFFWGRKINLVTTLFFINRYLPLLQEIVIIVHKFLAVVPKVGNNRPILAKTDYFVVSTRSEVRYRKYQVLKTDLSCIQVVFLWKEPTLLDWPFFSWILAVIGYIQHPLYYILTQSWLVILGIRTYALYERKKSILILLVISACLEIGFSGVSTVTFKPQKLKHWESMMKWAIAGSIQVLKDIGAGRAVGLGKSICSSALTQQE